MAHPVHPALLPDWLRVCWIAALSLVAAIHVRHVWVLRGEHRYWHVGHVLMAAGMVYMYLPASAHVVSATGAMAVFAVAAAAAMVTAAATWWREGVFNPLWILTAVEMTVMVYMFVPASSQPVMLNAALAVYLFGIGVLWAIGGWDRHYLARHGPTARRTTPPLRASLVTMAAGMVYMLVAM